VFSGELSWKPDSVAEKVPLEMVTELGDGLQVIVKE
jgi:hypothetical protein